MTSFGVNPLVDGFMAEHGAAVLFGEDSCDDFRRPFLAEPGFNLGSESLVFKARPAVTVLMSDSGDELGSERMVMLLGQVATELPGEGCVRPSQSPADGSQRFAALKHNSKDLSFFFVQMRVEFHRPPFYPMKPLHLVVH